MEGERAPAGDSRAASEVMMSYAATVDFGGAISLRKIDASFLGWNGLAKKASKRYPTSLS